MRLPSASDILFDMNLNLLSKSIPLFLSFLDKHHKDLNTSINIIFHLLRSSQLVGPQSITLIQSIRTQEESLKNTQQCIISHAMLLRQIIATGTTDPHRQFQLTTLEMVFMLLIGSLEGDEISLSNWKNFVLSMTAPLPAEENPNKKRKISEAKHTSTSSSFLPPPPPPPTKKKTVEKTHNPPNLANSKGK